MEHEGEYRKCAPEGAPAPDGAGFRALLALPAAEFAARCETERMQLGGPGGQHRNRVKTGVRLRYAEWPDLEGVSGESRDGGRNLLAAADQLRLVAACCLRHAFPDELPALPWRADSPVSAEHPLYPLWASLALDALAEENGSPAAAARRMGRTTSSYLRCLRAQKLAWAAAGKIRESLGLPPLKAPGA